MQRHRYDDVDGQSQSRGEEPAEAERGAASAAELDRSDRSCEPSGIGTERDDRRRAGASGSRDRDRSFEDSDTVAADDVAVRLAGGASNRRDEIGQPVEHGKLVTPELY